MSESASNGLNPPVQVQVHPLPVRLLKVPKAVADRWNQAQPSEILGHIVRERKMERLVLPHTPASSSMGVDGSSIRQYKVQSKPTEGVYVKGIATQGGEAVMSLEGEVQTTSTLVPFSDDLAAQQKLKKRVQLAQPERRVQTIETNPNERTSGVHQPRLFSYYKPDVAIRAGGPGGDDDDSSDEGRPAPARAAVAQQASRKPPSKQRDPPMDPDKLKDVLFRLFESQDAWNIKDLVGRTNQPHTHLKSVVELIADNDKQPGDKKQYYRLKPEFSTAHPAKRVRYE
ncbi:unnamed protein product [Vitrella brassicaformis CCMP3155]|uniref:TFIIF beta subunit HTH domain-containing protein n=2 Tax=Vitrella brassicaformis TaxID=1169539 RepID=A0A0G4H4A6_VITBC|nr:unnamed protein product [Vitrella brassicaformis CCMP3155]|eukprot:CEM38596.1 unnamed protein product [Vitrella brassicaformis CCMP3155]